MNIDFAGKSVIVTGAGHGFGRAIAHEFCARGAVTFACDVNEAGLAVTAAEAKPAQGGRLKTAAVDVTDRNSVGGFVDGIGRVDVLINNAGGVCGQVGQPLEQVTPRQWQQIFDVNVTGAFNFAQAVAPSMKKSGAGRIVNISSGAGLGVSLTGIQAYAAAKAAQIGLTRQLAHELGPFGITVNNVAPGFVRSNPTTEKQWESYGEEGQKRLVESLWLRRLGSASDIAHAVLFFASDYAGWITGQVLSVNGGR
jgi:3-oxoacyl-[acyl-carrier protein] reductase